MKKIFLALVAFVGILSATSCGSKTAEPATVTTDSVEVVVDTLEVDSVVVDSIATDTIL